MWNIELARIIQEEREREIEADLRLRQLTRPTGTSATTDAVMPRTRRVQRPASNGAASAGAASR
jgi:hypothetical protein